MADTKEDAPSADVASRDHSFVQLIARVRCRDEEAAAELVRLYEPQVRRAVRVRMGDPVLRRAVDSLDICQSVLANFFVRTASGEFELDEPQQLVALLVKMAQNKIYDWHRKQTALRRDNRRRVPLADAETVIPRVPPLQTPTVGTRHDLRCRFSVMTRVYAFHGDGQDRVEQRSARSGRARINHFSKKTDVASKFRKHRGLL